MGFQLYHGSNHRAHEELKFTLALVAQKAFENIKHELNEAPLLALPNFKELFEVERDASGVGIGAVLTQLRKFLAYFSQKLNSPKLNYST